MIYFALCLVIAFLIVACFILSGGTRQAVNDLFAEIESHSLTKLSIDDLASRLASKEQTLQGYKETTVKLRDRGDKYRDALDEIKALHTDKLISTARKAVDIAKNARDAN